MELAKQFIIHQHLCQLLKIQLFMEPTHMWEQFIAHLIKSILLIDHLAWVAQEILEQWVTNPTAIMTFVIPTPYKPLMEDVQDAHQAPNRVWILMHVLEYMLLLLALHFRDFQMMVHDVSLAQHIQELRIKILYALLMVAIQTNMLLQMVHV